MLSLIHIYEFKLVVPKGYTRFLGKISELTDLGVEVHFFIGNHDIWCGDYLEKECGVTIHRQPLTCEIYGKEFFLAHGDGLGDKDAKFKLLRSMFHSTTLRTLFSTIHPRWSIELGLEWAKHSRLKREGGKEPEYMGEDTVSYTHLDVYKRQVFMWRARLLRRNPMNWVKWVMVL